MKGRLGAYEILGSLGEGGMGVVYRVRHLNLGGEYALKTIPLDSDPETVARTRREGEAMAQLSGHPHVVSVHTLFEDQGQLCLVMELCPGGDLQTRLERGPLAPTEAARIVAGLADGLAAAHGAGILHRDLKPANVLFDAGGVPKLTDFGIARVADSQSLTQTGSLLGTPSYMSPEQAQGLRADARSDVYGLGAILYQCLSGAPPFGPGPILSVLHQVVHKPPPPLPPGVPPALAALCLRALAKEPRDRFETAFDLRDELESETGNDAALRLALKVGLAVLALLSAVLAGVLVIRGLDRMDLANPSPSQAPSPSAAPAVSRPLATPANSPAVTPTPSPTPARASAQLAPPPEDPWLLSLPPWPETPGERALTPEQARDLSRLVARFPPLSAAAWRARGLRTHAAPRPKGPTHLADLPGPDWEFFARAFQDLEAHPTSLHCLAAAAKGIQNHVVRGANNVRGHRDYGRWLLVRATAEGSGAGLRRLSRSFVPLEEGATALNQASETVRRAWRKPGPPSQEVQAAWRVLEGYAQAAYAKPLRRLLPPDPPRKRPHGPTANRALAEIASRNWDLLLLLESAARAEGPDAPRTSALGQRYPYALVQEVAAAVGGEVGAIRSLGQRLQSGEGLLKDRVAGRVLLYLAIEEGGSRRSHALYNLGHGSTGDTVLAAAPARRYTADELVYLVLSRGYRKTDTALRDYRKLKGRLPLPSEAEAELRFLELRARELDGAGLLGRDPWAYGRPPRLPDTEPTPPHTVSTGINVHLRAWLPHSLVLRIMAREAAQLPALEFDQRRATAKNLGATDPLRAAHFLRGALESDRIAARHFIETLAHSPVADPVLRARLMIAMAFFGTPRVLRNFDAALAELGKEWQLRTEAIKPAIARIYWESEKLNEIQKARVGLDSTPSLEESWKLVRAFDAELAEQPLLQRLSSWSDAPFLPGTHVERVTRGVRRLAFWHSEVASLLAEGEPGEERELLGAAKERGDAKSLLRLAATWSKTDRHPLARAALVIALEGLPQEEWAAGAPVAEALFLPDLAGCLRSLAKTSTEDAWRVFNRERELALLGAGLPSVADLDAWGVPR